MRNMIICLICCFVFCTLAIAGSIKGTIRNSGVGIVQSVHIIDEDTKSETLLCSGEISSKVKKLSGMVVEIGGEPKKIGRGTSECFDASNFKVLRLSSGRVPLIGFLKVEKDGFAVIGDDGVKHNLTEVSSGLKSLVGKRIILDARSSDTGLNNGLKVISYSIFPE